MDLDEGQMCSESKVVTTRKRRISPDTSPRISPERKQSPSWFTATNPSWVYELVNDPAIMQLSYKLVEDLDLGFVEMAEELVLSLLQGDGTEHLLSLRIWHNQELLNELVKSQLMPTMKEISLEDQHFEERMGRIMKHPSFKYLLGLKEDFIMMRVAIIILLAYRIDGDNENETTEDEQDGSEDMENCISLDESMIFELVEHPCIKNIACKVERGSGLAIILDELMKSVHVPRASLHEDCKAHFKIVNMAWEDNQLISSLLKQKHMIQDIYYYFHESRKQLRETLTPLIKAHPSMKDILLESEASSVRRALTILIGYLSTKNMVLDFDDAMGHGDSVGIRTVRYSYTPGDMKVEPTSESGVFMQPVSCECDPLKRLMPDPSLVTQLLHDASFKDVAQQIQCDPLALKFADIVLECLAYESDEPYISSGYLHNVFSFWRNALLIHLRRALKKSPKPSLFNLFKELSNGAEMLRLKERLIRIREDNFWKTTVIDERDFSLRMRLALSILIGYWSAIDVTRVAMPILNYQRENPSKAHLLEDLRDVEIINYWADSNNDMEGLKNVLASKYVKDSPEFKRRVVEIEYQQKCKVAEAVVRGYDNTVAQITALLKGDSCISLSFSWFSKTRGVV